MTGDISPSDRERLTAIETALRYEIRRINQLEAKLDARLDESTQQAQQRGDHSRPSVQLDGAALLKLGIAGAMILVTIILQMAGRPELAATLGNLGR